MATRISARRIRNACVLLVWAVGSRAGAQAVARTPSPIFVGSDAENYLRYQQSLGAVRLHPWSMRGFSDADLKAMGADSATAEWLRPAGRRLGSKRFGVDVLPASANAIYNTLFPYGFNDGATWAGRGLTLEMSGGVTARFGPVRATVAPTFFWTENQAFPLMPVPDTSRPYGDPTRQDNVDRPQRFGSLPYSRLDPGQTGIRIEGLGAQAGFSWENRWWGPMSEFPYILGNNAAGFPHLFFGTASPRNIRVGRLSGMILYGRADQTEFSPVDSGNTHRFVSGAIMVFQPTWFPGLELGAARFFHVPWPDSGLRRDYFTHLFETFVKARIRKVLVQAGNPAEKMSGDNQLASVFARWAMPQTGVEVYAEFGRDDHNWDGRDMIVELDHTAAIGLGIRKSWRRADGIGAIRFESMNHQQSPLARHRGQGGAYYHGFTPQGHTHLGQLLGTAAAAGNGAAAMTSYERTNGAGQMRISWTRLQTVDPDFGAENDAQHVLRYERIRRLGSSAHYLAASTILDLNRNLRGRAMLSLRIEAGLTRF